MINESITDQIKSAVENVPGWSPLDQLLSLFFLVYTSSDLPGDILEIGSWCGRSAIALGLAAKLIGKSKVYCVDLFPEKQDWVKNLDGSYSFSVTIAKDTYYAYCEQTVWEEPFLRDIAPVYELNDRSLDVFCNNIEKQNLRSIVYPFKGTLEKFANSASANLKLKLVFIDGDHSYSAVSEEIIIAKRYLVSGGWICFDDAFTSYEGVNEAIMEHVVKSGEFELSQQITRKLFIARRKR